MRQYIRDRTAGGTYFLTFNLLNRQQTLLTDNIDKVRQAYRLTQQHQPFSLQAMVILPEHIHWLIQLPINDDNYAARVSLFKAAFSRQMAKTEILSQSRMAKRERGIWQRRFWEHRIRDEHDFKQHMDYIHYNPVKHGYTVAAKDWPFSTFHHWVSQKVYSQHWGSIEKN
ncbi:transposase [uncultured Agitococcus sp.]|uniref:REP-associated tyrosine transposase n=1 Tax=uncultured Agitococcus sp. TaxID=1506599 RepID=UPI00261019CE|nr:transposase [uncultured Agitococcus sp.]